MSPPIESNATVPNAAASARPVRRRFAFGLVLAVLVLVADQASKAWILWGLNLPLRQVVPLLDIPPFGLNFTMVWNQGVTFGMLSGDSPWNPLLLALGAVIIGAFLLRWMWRAETLAVALALGAVVGGAVGNVADRLRFRAVVDFVDASAWGWHWYVFNLADAAIVLGVVTLLADALLRRRPEAKESA